MSIVAPDLFIPYHEDRVAWYVEHYCPNPTTDDLRCLDVLASLGAFYNWPRVGIAPAIERGGPWMPFVGYWRSDLATWDSDGLTRLVVAAHRNRVRVSLGASRRLGGSIAIQTHPRDTDGGPSARHPGLLHDTGGGSPMHLLGRSLIAADPAERARQRREAVEAAR